QQRGDERLKHWHGTWPGEYTMGYRNAGTIRRDRSPFNTRRPRGDAHNTPSRRDCETRQSAVIESRPLDRLQVIPGRLLASRPSGPELCRSSITDGYFRSIIGRTSMSTRRVVPDVNCLEPP